MMSKSSITSASPSRSPQPFVEPGAATSSAPATPVRAESAMGHGDGLRPRMAAIVDGAAGISRRVGLPQIVGAVRDASVTHAVVGALRDTVAPAVSLAADTMATVSKAARQASRPSLSSQPLQAALRADMTQPSAQMNAHWEALAYGAHSAQMLDRVLPFAHVVSRIGLAGSAMTLGLGRSSGMAAGDALGRIERGAPVSGGLIIGGPDRPATTLSSTAAAELAATGVQQWALGSVGAAVGNIAGQFLLGPLVNMIPRQFQPIDARALVPQEMVDLMNTLRPGAGNELRDQVKAAQVEVANLASPSNVLLGQISFDVVTAGRFAATGTSPLGAAGQVSLGLGISGTAGVLIGAVMATRQAAATIDIPDIAALADAAAHSSADGSAALERVSTTAMPLFFAKHTTAPGVAAGTSHHDIEPGGLITTPNAEQGVQASRIRENVMRVTDTLTKLGQTVVSGVTVAASALKQGFVMSPLVEPLPTTAPGTSGGGRGLSTASNFLASGVRRAVLIAKATATTTAMSTASAMLGGATEGAARRAVLAVGNAIGIHAAIKPGFDALARDIPMGDIAMRARRQEHVNAKAAARPSV